MIADTEDRITLPDLPRHTPTDGSWVTSEASILDQVPTAARTQSFAAGTLALLAHAAIAFAIVGVSVKAVERAAPALISELVEVELPPPEPEAPAPEPEKPRVEPPQPKPARVTTPTETPPPEQPPAAAQAASVVTTAESIDFGDTFVVGNGSAYAGGVTDGRGTSTQAVRDVTARATRIEPVKVVAAVTDRSRAAALAGGDSWDCPFPREADDESIDSALVGLAIRVSADGRAVEARVARDPGTGFGREARRCALRKRWAPALDRSGQPVPSEVRVNVRFNRR